MAFSREDTLGKVKSVIIEKLEIKEDTITPDATLKDLGADSLDIADMIMQFEGIFGVEVKDEDAERIKTIEEAVDYLHAARTK